MGKNCQPKILDPAKLSCQNEGEMKIISGKQTLEFATIRLILKERLKGVLQVEIKNIRQYLGCIIKYNLL